MTDTSDRDALVRLAGEQALLSRDLRNLNADQQRDLLALRNLPTEMVLHADWHAKGTALLARLTGINTAGEKPCLCMSALSRLPFPFHPAFASNN
ncbi:hypothetical protein [Comamonas terrae]|uniref:Uncharacterized protein n=1 Tax=Comamonas terrae TaxID=673548 RepID=A0ABW5UP69_9BURK|nr:hypothetical protein [Comamonas terrae]